MSDIQFMKSAFDLACKGRGKTSPNPMVGSVVVRGNKIVGEGWHEKCGGAHAEVIALKNAGKLAKGAKLYVTLEPCCHFGRTPPCVDLIIACGIKEVVVGMKDPNPLTNGKSISRMRSVGIKVTVGVLEKELKLLNSVFIKYIKKKTPFVVSKTAQTLDGKIATSVGCSKWITSAKTRKITHGMRNDFDAIMVGINTVVSDNPGLNASIKSKKLKKIILDSKLKISLTAKLFKNTKPEDIFIATTKSASKRKIKQLECKGINVVVCPDIEGKVKIKWLLKELARAEIASVLIEGGAKVVGSALKEKVIDKMHIFIAKKIIGDQKGLSSIDGLDVSRVNRAVQLKNVKVKDLGEDLFVDGEIK